MELEAKQKQELEELIALLEDVKGRHTQLVSVYISTGFNINSVVHQLEAEKSTAANIKSKQTRNAVTTALETIVRKLKSYDKTPPKGLAVFAGNVSTKEGTQDVQIWTIEPPRPLKVRLYRCDQTFVLDPLLEMLEVEELYGLITIDRQEATIGLLEGKRIKVLRSLTSGIPRKVRAGGQSAARFSRISEGLAKDFFRRVAEAAKEEFFPIGDRIKGILVGGPIPTKEDFLEEGQLVTKLKEKIIAVKDIGYVDEHGLDLLVEASQEDIAKQELIKEKKILEKFFNILGKTRSKAAYGFEQTKLALERGAVETLLLSKKLDKTETEELEKMAENIGSEVVIVSTDNQDGEQFLNLTSGIGAILRFALE